MPTLDRLTIEARVQELARVRGFIRAAAARLTDDADTLEDLVLAANELVTNIMLHGYRGQYGAIEIEVGYSQAGLTVRLRDQAPLFDPTSVPAPDISRPLSQRPPGGMGVHMTRQLVDRLDYRVTERGGNEVTLVKHVALRDQIAEDGYAPDS